MQSRYTFGDEGINKIHAGSCQYHRHCFSSGLMLALGDEGVGKLLPPVFRQACPTGDVLAAVQDAEIPTQEVGQGVPFLSWRHVAPWSKETDRTCSAWLGTALRITGVGECGPFQD